MCGISVIVDPEARADSLQRLLAMHRAIPHRGPDGEGLLAISADGTFARAAAADAIRDGSTAVGIAFRRLRILDLTDAADQPMSSPDGKQWIAFNGEIYNFADVRQRLIADGYEFRSSGDTEVILNAYRRWGTECFNELDGMWAIVIVDLAKRKIVVCRDRFGIKPLYWAIADARLYLASESKQIVEALGVRPRANLALVTKYLQGARIPNLYETFFEDVRSVPAAYWFDVELGEPLTTPRFQCYWRLPSVSSPDPPSYSTAVDLTENALRGAVRTHSVADVRVGTLLSGGLDSSIVTAIFAQQRRDADLDRPTFSFGFRREFPESSEFEYSDAVARAYGLANQETTLDPTWIRQRIDRVIRAMEEPSLALAALGQYRVFELCRAHGVTVALDGQGADEIFGGYPYHERLFVLDRLRRRRWSEAVSELNAISRRDGRWRAAVVLDYLWYWGRSKVRRFQNAFPWLASVPIRASELEAYADRGSDPSAFYRQIYWDIKWGNVRLILDYADKNAMSWSVEARVPYFDRSLVEAAMTFPDTYKVFGGERKRVLRDVGRRLLPKEVTERRTRMGFGMPDEHLIEQLWPTIRDEITDTSFSTLPIFERPEFDAFMKRSENPDLRDHRAVWRLWALARWMRVFHATV